MNDSQSVPPLPKIPAVLVLAGPLRPLASPGHGLHETARQEVAAGADNLLKILGIPGKLVVSLEDGEADKVPGPMLTLTVNDQACWPGGDRAVRLMARMAKNGGGAEANLRLLIDLLKETCLEILKDQPDVLLDLPQAEFVARELSRPRRHKGGSLPDWPPDSAGLLAALRVPLGLGISIADRLAVSQILGENVSLWEAPEDLGELLAGALSAKCIEIRLPPERFPDLTLAWQENGGEAFSQVRVNLGKETGLKLPPFSFQTDADLADDQFSFRFQHLPGPALTGLTLDKLVAEMKAEFFSQLSRLVVLPQVEAQLELVESELRDMVSERIPLPRLTRELRRRARQDGRLRRLALILEELLDEPFAAAGAPGMLALR